MNTDYFSLNYFIVFFIIIINIQYILKKTKHQKKVRKLIRKKLRIKEKANMLNFERKEIEKEKLSIEKKKLNFLVDNSTIEKVFDEYVVISENIEEELTQKISDQETHIKDIESLLLESDEVKNFNNYYINQQGRIVFTKEEI